MQRGEGTAGVHPMFAATLGGLVFACAWLSGAILHWTRRGVPGDDLALVVAAGVSQPIFMGLLLGAVWFAIVRVIRRAIPDLSIKKRTLLEATVLLLLTLLCSFVIYRDDLIPAATRWSGKSARPWLLLLLQASFGATVAISYMLGHAMRGPRARWIVLVAAFGGMLVNQRALPGLYPGLHLLFALAAVAFVLSAWQGDDAKKWSMSGSARFGLALAAIMLFSLGFRGAQKASSVTSLRASGSVTLPLARRVAFLFPRRSGPPPDSTILDEVFERGPRPASTPSLLGSSPIVVLLTVDALRADLLEGETYRNALPNLHALRDEGLAFENARSMAPATHVSLASLFLGKAFSQLKWRETSENSDTGYGTVAEDETVRLGFLLEGAGITTSAVAASRFLRAAANELIFPTGPVLLAEHDPERLYAGASSVFAGLLRQLASLQEERAPPRLIYAHLMDPHSPYDLGSTEGSDFDRYLSEVSLVDEALGALREELEKRSLDERITWIITGDHGEAFGEHGLKFHASHLLEEFVRVPLLIRVPGVRPGVSESPVSLVDVSATILDLFGVSIPAGHIGESLVPALRGQSLPADRAIVLEAGTGKRGVIFADRLKLLERKGIFELYDLEDDPKERLNLFDEHPRSNLYLGAMVNAFRRHEYREPGYQRPYVWP